MRCLFFILLLGLNAEVWAQNSGQSTSNQASSGQSSSAQQSSAQPDSTQSGALPSAPAPSDSQKHDSTSKAQSGYPLPNPNLAPPRSDRIDVNDLGDDAGVSSSKDTQIDLSPPSDDAKAHAKRSDRQGDAAKDTSTVNELHPWDPHRAAKDIEVGDFYFKRKNYRGAESRYRDALFYKDNDALATYRLAVCLEKMNRPAEALEKFENYLRILPHGPYAEEAKKSIERINRSSSSAKK